MPSLVNWPITPKSLETSPPEEPDLICTVFPKAKHFQVSKMFFYLSGSLLDVTSHKHFKEF